MRWDRLFDDLEDQLSSEWEAERAALDTEAERLRFSKVTLRERLGALRGRGAAAAAVRLELAGDATAQGALRAMGTDWLALEPEDAAQGVLIVPMEAISAVRLGAEDLLRSARPPAEATSALAERMTLGYVLRDLARRRSGVTVRTSAGLMLAGTIDRAAADHCDLALHDAGQPRRRSNVTGYQLVPFGAIAWVRVDRLDVGV